MLKLAVAGLLALTGVCCAQSPPTFDTRDLVERQTTAYVVNGDFSDPLEGTWLQDADDGVTAETITRVRNHGNPVLQISANCSEANTGVAVVGLIANVSKGPRYLVSWDYAISEHRDDVRWRFAALIRVQPRGGHGLRGLEYKRIVKKKDFYTFSGSFDINSLRDRPRVSNPTNVTLHIRYPICNFGPDFAGYIQIDNVRIEQI